MPSSNSLKIFISHSHLDNDYARAFVTSLQTIGADVWYDEINIGGGDQWLNLIQQEVQSRPVFIVLLSRNSVGALWVRAETNLALSIAIQDKSRIILPVIIDPEFKISDIDTFAPLLKLRQIIRGETFEDNVRGVISALNLLSVGIPAGETEAVTKGENTQELVDSGNAARARQNYQQAVDYYNRVLETEPNNTTALNGLAITLSELGDYDGSLSFYQKLLTLEPNNSFNWFNRARLLVELGQFNEAISNYNKALQIEESEVKASTRENFLIKITKLELYVRICYYKGIALRLMGKYDEALQTYNQALSISPQMHLRANRHLRKVFE